LLLPARSPNLNAHAERWVRSVKDECLSKIIPFGERSVRRAMKDYMAHYRSERNHQGKNNVLLFQQVADTRRDSPVRCRDRLAGLCGTIIEKRRENRNLAIALCFTDVGRARLPTGVKRSVGIE
jgi:Integrase core domain